MPNDIKGRFITDLSTRWTESRPSILVLEIDVMDSITGGLTVADWRSLSQYILTQQKVLHKSAFCATACIAVQPTACQEAAIGAVQIHFQR